MKEEFNLSEEGQQLEGLEMPFYSEKDVKEFIRLLKENIIKCPEREHTSWKQKTATFVGHKQMKTWFLEIIDKLAGEKLI